ncbi:hypothetical protein KKG48_01655 [Patescibacteria group bacterium]|nr:hypothetical protein [Patescibacteria group bacterium]MCG2695255.1 hypothetical protein [Candidatus Parcubacteria bacterium]
MDALLADLFAFLSRFTMPSWAVVSGILLSWQVGLILLFFFFIAVYEVNTTEKFVFLEKITILFFILAFLSWFTTHALRSLFSDVFG